MIIHTIVHCDFKPREKHYVHMHIHKKWEEERVRERAFRRNAWNEYEHLTNFLHKVPYNWKSWNASWPDNQSMGHRANVSCWFCLHCNYLVINTNNAASCFNFYPISFKFLLSKWTYSFIKPTRLNMTFILAVTSNTGWVKNVKDLKPDFLGEGRLALFYEVSNTRNSI